MKKKCTKVLDQIKQDIGSYKEKEEQLPLRAVKPPKWLTVGVSSIFVIQAIALKEQTKGLNG